MSLLDYRDVGRGWGVISAGERNPCRQPVLDIVFGRGSDVRTDLSPQNLKGRKHRLPSSTNFLMSPL